MVIHINNIKFLGLTQYIDFIEECSVIIGETQIDAWIKITNSHVTLCPHCGTKSIMKIKEHPTVDIHHVNDKYKPIYLHVRNNRLLCTHCNKSFTPLLPFVFKDFPRISVPTVVSILSDLQTTDHSFSEVARNHWVSDKTVARIFEARVSFGHGIPTSYMCIDEKCYIHGNTKFCLPILDFESNKLIDICKDRHKSTLLEWLRFVRDYYVMPPSNKALDTSTGISKDKNRTVKLECICIDMSQNFYDAIKQVFPYCPVAIDSFHVVRNVIDCLNTVRIKVMKKYYKEELLFDTFTGELLDEERREARQPVEYRAIKKYWKLLALNKDIVRLPPEQKKYNIIISSYADQADVLDFILAIDDDLRLAWQLKEIYCYFNRNATIHTAGEWLNQIILEFAASRLKPFVEMARTLEHWKPEIINSFIRVNGRRISNGPMEGMNSKLEKLIINGNGIPKIETLRNRALLKYGKNNGFILNPKVKNNK